MSRQFHSRSAVLDGFADTARQLSLNPIELLSAHGLPASCLATPDLKIPTAKIIQLLEDSAAQACIADFGLRMAQARLPATLGAIELIMREKPSLRAALESLSNYLWSQSEGILMHLEVEESTCSLTVLVSPELPKPATQTIELALASLTGIISRLLAKHWKPKLVVLDHSQPERVASHIQAFKQVPVFSYEYSALIFDTAELDREIPNANPESARRLEQYFQSVVGPRPTNFSERVQEMIQVLLPRGDCSIETIAQLVKVDRRTVHRRLVAEGTTYSQLLSVVRNDLASIYINRGGRSMTEVAPLLGFANLSSFSRWRRRSRPVDTETE